jgi:glycerate kinase
MSAGLRVLIAPDCFGDTLTAVQAAEAIAAGWRQTRPGDVLTVVPLSDGGPGFVEVLAARHSDWRIRRVPVRGPLAGDVDAKWVLDRAGSAGYIESAQACGLALLGAAPSPQTATDAHSAGVGQLIGDALACGATTVVVGLGGSACTDGGRGMVEALGGLAAARQKLLGVNLIAATDVEHPLLGPTGAARIFAPQKGADPQTVELLESRLAAWAVELNSAAGQPVANLPGAGAAGGLGAALLALGGRRESGAALIAAHTGALDALARSDLLVTGEGLLDDQSLHGKVVGSLTAAARVCGVDVLVLAGQVRLPEQARRLAGITSAHAVADHAGSVRAAMTDAAYHLFGLAARTAADWPGRPAEGR